MTITKLTEGTFPDIATPDEEDRGEQLFVPGATGVADFIGFGRKNAADVNEWFPLGDTFQVSLVPSQFIALNLPVGNSQIGNRVSVDLTDYTEVRFGLRVTGVGVTGRVKLRYDDDGSGDADLTTNFIALNTLGAFQTAWEPILTAARGPISVVAVAYNGDGTEDPTGYAVVAHFRR